MTATWWTQLRILSKKNYYIARANPKSTIMQFLTPILVCLMLIVFQLTADVLFNDRDRYPSSDVITPLIRCTERPGIPCKTVVYAPIDMQFAEGFTVEDVMRAVADEAGLSFEDDFLGLPYSEEYPCEYDFSGGGVTDFFESLRGCGNFTAEYIFNNPNSTSSAVVFYPAINFTDLGLPPGTDLPPSPVIYEIFYNSTVLEGESNFAINVKRAIDTAIFRLQGYQGLDIAADSRPFPYPPPRLKGFDVVAVVGAIWFFIIPMLTFFVLLTEIVQEKELRIRIGMRMMGMSDSAFWVSWFVNACVFVSGSTLVLMIFGAMVQFEVVLNCNVVVFFAIFWAFGMGMACLAFFLSTLIGSSKTAQTVGYAMILIGFVFQNILGGFQGYFVALIFDGGNPNWVIAIRWILSFYPPFLFAKVYYDTAVLSASSIDTTGLQIVEGEGFGWNDMYKSRTVEIFGNDPFTIPPMYESLLFMLFDIFFFCLLTWYFDNTLAGEHGSPRHPLFFLEKSYWFGGARSKQEIESDAKDLRRRHEGYKPPSNAEADVIDEARSAVSADCKAVVRITGLEVIYRASRLFKSAEDVKAVDNIFLTIPEGQLLTILGHNGAGKTTTIGVLTGLVTPTAGTVSINGIDAIRDVAETRRLMGVCPQHDILWMELTAAQHLEIFSELKGVPHDQVQKSITEALETVGLLQVANKRVGEFSGGMKRRTSVAIASIGDPKIMFLDEPTTGMDPLNRRDVWMLIEKLKKNRVIILTTHSMEEADVLSDRIAIMSHGKIEAVGNSLFLKAKYGNGYRVALVSSLPDGDTGPARQFVGKYLPKAIIRADDGGSIMFDLPFSEVHSLPTFFAEMEKVMAKEGVANPKAIIREWGLSHATLEEVFLAVAKRSNFTYDHAKIEMSNTGVRTSGGIKLPSSASSASSSSAGGANQPLLDKARSEPGSDNDHDTTVGSRHEIIEAKMASEGMPLRALWSKNIALQKRQKGTNCCQIATPLLVMAILWLMQIIIESEFENSSEALILPPNPLNYNIIRDRQDPPVYNQEGNATSMCYQYYSYAVADPALREIVGGIDSNGVGSGMLRFMPQAGCNYTAENGTLISINVPFTKQFEDQPTMTESIFQTLKRYNDADLDELETPPIAFEIEDAAFTYLDVDLDALRLHYEIGIHDSSNVYYHRPNNFTRLSGTFQLNSSDTFNADLLLLEDARIAVIETIHNMFIIAADPRWQALYANVSSDVPRLLKPIQTLLRVMPYEQESDLLIILESLGVFLFPIAMSMQMPVYLFLIVMEKEDKLREMMKSSGMSMNTYWFSNYLYFILLYTCVFIFFYLGGLFIQMRFFTQTDPVLLVIFFLGWGHSLIGLAFLVSACLSSKRSATVMGYVIALIGSMLSLFVAVNLYPYEDGEVMPEIFLLYSQFSFARGVYIMVTDCSLYYQCLSLTDIESGDEMYGVLISLWLTAFFYTVLALYLDQVLPSQFGVPKHPLFFLDPIKEWWARQQAKKNASAVGTLRIADVNTGLGPRYTSIEDVEANNGKAHADPHEDPDVAAERLKVETGMIDPHAPVIIRNLRKVFGDNKVAVKNLSMHIDDGECFGLLGPNGAGKTTTISMLSGLYQPTSGSATVGGFDITTQMEKVHLITGICPQFSILWELLSCIEHILFYCRLKGVAKDDEIPHAMSVLKQVGLDGCPDRLAGQLSGGMKRRLSVAIALCGNNKVVFLDEPSTGLDPASRRQLWAIIQQAKKGRAIILTTHSMDEAEALATRIGIFVNGSLRVLGDQTHLKNRAGEGFRIYANYAVGDTAAAQAFISRVIPGVKLLSQFPGTSSYSVKELDVAKLFKVMDEEKGKHGVTDWGVSQITLEDVFIHTVRTAENEDVAQ